MKLKSVFILIFLSCFLINFGGIAAQENEQAYFMIDTDIATAGYQGPTIPTGIGANKKVGFAVYLKKFDQLRGFSVDFKWDGTKATFRDRDSDTEIVDDDIHINGQYVTMAADDNILGTVTGILVADEEGHYNEDFAKFAKLGDGAAASDEYGLLYFFVLKTANNFLITDRLVVTTHITIYNNSGFPKDLSFHNFYVNSKNPTITVASPNGGENLTAGSSFDITWNSSDVSNILIEFSSDNGLTWDVIADNVDALAGSYSWTVPDVESSECFVRITDMVNSEVTDESDGTFIVSSQPFEPSEISELIDHIEDLINNTGLNKGLKNSLSVKLNGAESKLCKGNIKAAVNQLEAFINHVEALSGKKLDSVLAEEIIAAAQDIIDLISEPGGAAKPVVSFNETELPGTYNLSQNTPNPFNPVTTIQYAIPAGKSVRTRLLVYDLRGARVRTLIDEVHNPGIHYVIWDGTDDTGNRVSSGIYIYRLQAGEFSKSNKMLLVR